MNTDEINNIQPDLNKAGVICRYYLLSTKWTGSKDGFLTLWRTNGRGYCWYKEWAGLYDEEDIKKYQGEGIVPVREDIVDGLWQAEFFDGEERQVLINAPQVLKALGISSKELQKDYRSNCPRKHQVMYDAGQ